MGAPAVADKPACSEAQIHDLSEPASTLEDRLRNLERVVELLKADASFQNGQLLCLNSRFAWMSLYQSWHRLQNQAEQRLANLKRYVAGMKIGRMYLSTVRTNTEEEAYYLPRYMRSTRVRWEWARMLLETEDFQLVTGAMEQYERSVRESADQTD